MTDINIRAIAADIARELRERPERWTQGTFAREPSGDQCHWRDRDASCFCLIGHVRRALLRTGMSAEEILFREDNLLEVFWLELPPLQRRGGLAEWNDAAGRSVKEIIRLCEKVAGGGA